MGDEKQLRKAIIRLAHERPEFRDDLPPLVTREAAGWKESDLAPVGSKQAMESRDIIREVGVAMRSVLNRIEALAREGYMPPQDQAKFLRKVDRGASDFIGKVADLYRAYAR